MAVRGGSPGGAAGPGGRWPGDRRTAGGTGFGTISCRNRPRTRHSSSR